MARKMQAIHGGAVCRAKKIQTVYGGVVKNAKSAWMVSNGLWRKFFTGKPVSFGFETGGFHYAIGQDPTTISNWATVSSMSAGYLADGDIRLSVYSNNSAMIDVGAPSARLVMTFDGEVGGKLLTITFNNNVDLNGVSGNSLIWQSKQTGDNFNRTYMTNSWGSGQTNTYVIPAGTYELKIIMVLGQASTSEFDDSANVTIHSITLDGEEILH